MVEPDGELVMNTKTDHIGDPVGQWLSRKFLSATGLPPLQTGVALWVVVCLIGFAIDVRDFSTKSTWLIVLNFIFGVSLLVINLAVGWAVAKSIEAAPPNMKYSLAPLVRIWRTVVLVLAVIFVIGLAFTPLTLLFIRWFASYVAEDQQYPSLYSRAKAKIQTMMANRPQRSIAWA